MNGPQSLVFLLLLGALLVGLFLYLDRGIDEWAEADNWERAQRALAAHSVSRKPSQWDRCVECHEPVLVENTQRGVCSDCLDDDPHAPSHEEWVALMRQIDDEGLDSEDHR